MATRCVNLRSAIELISQHNGWIFGSALRKFIVPKLTKSSTAATILDPDNTGMNVWFAHDSDWQKFKSVASCKDAKILNERHPLIEYEGYLFQIAVGAVFPIIDHDIDGLVFQLKSQHITWASLTLAKPTQLLQQICNHECTLSLNRMQRGFSDAWFPYSAPEGFAVFTPALPGQNRVQVDIRDIRDEGYTTFLCKPYTNIVVLTLGDALLTTTVEYTDAELDTAFTVCTPITTHEVGNPSTPPTPTSPSSHELETYCRDMIRRLVAGLESFPKGAPETVYVALTMIVFKEVICACKHLKLPEQKQKCVDVLEVLYDYIDGLESCEAKLEAQKGFLQVMTWVVKTADFNSA